MDLTTSYLGLKLKNPLVPSASPLSRNLDTCRELEDAGASAIVMYSLFEEQILAEEQQLDHLMHFQDVGHGEADSYLPVDHAYRTCQDEYLEQLQALKQALNIPVIASLNGISEGGWVEHAAELQEAGADALELNIYYVAASMKESALDVENRYINILQNLKSQIDLPVTVKLSPHFSSLGHFVKRLEQAGANGIALFNRFYQPDLDLDTLDVKPLLHLSNPYEALLRMHWVALLHGRVNLSLAATGGIHHAEQVIKLLLAGADVTHLCSTLLKHGPHHLKKIRKNMKHWMDKNEYESVEQLKGSVSQQHAADPGAYERANYLELLSAPLFVRE